MSRCAACGSGALPPPPVGTEPVAFQYEANESRWPTVFKAVGAALALAAIFFAVQPLATRVNGSVNVGNGPSAEAATTTLPILDSTAAAPVADTSAPVGPVGPVAADPTGTVNIDGMTVTATCTARGSTDSAGNALDFKPENTLDDADATAWRCAGDGVGVSLTYALPTPMAIGQVGMVPGYATTDSFNGDDRFTQNRRITGARWVCLGADAAELAALEQAPAADRAIQTVVAAGFDACAAVRLDIVQSSAPGSRDFVAISTVRIAAKT